MAVEKGQLMKSCLRSEDDKTTWMMMIFWVINDIIVLSPYAFENLVPIFNSFCNFVFLC